MKRHVGLALRGERRRHAEEHRVGLAQAVEVGGGGEAAGGHRPRHPGAVEVAEVALAAPQPLDLGRVGVEAEHREAGLGEPQGEGEADVAQPHHPDPRRAGVDRFAEPGGEARGRSRRHGSRLAPASAGSAATSASRLGLAAAIPGSRVCGRLKAGTSPAAVRTSPPAAKTSAVPAATSHSLRGDAVQVASARPAATRASL